MTGNDERITSLEEEIAHLRLVNDELSAEVLAQWKRIERLEHQLSHLENRLNSIEDQSEAPEANVKPPHW